MFQYFYISWDIQFGFRFILWVGDV